MSEKVKCEIYLVIDTNGDYEVGPDHDAAIEAFDNSIGGGTARRIIKITALATPPEITETELDIPDEAGETTKVEAEAV